MIRCSICGKLANQPYCLRLDGEIIEHCSGGCHDPFIGEDVRAWRRNRKKEMTKYAKSFGRGRK